MRFLDEGTFCRTKKNRGFCGRLAFAIVGVWLLSCQLGSDGLNAQTQEPCKSNALERAEEAFDREEYQNAIALLQPCLPSVITNPAQKKRSHKLLALAHLAQGDSLAAEREIERLVRLEPAYQPDVERDPKIFQTIVVKIIERYKSNPNGSVDDGRGISKWWWIGGGALLVGGGTLTYFLIKNEPSLPEPQDIRNILK